jgi:hypothetical protein
MQPNQTGCEKTNGNNLYRREAIFFIDLRPLEKKEKA